MGIDDTEHLLIGIALIGAHIHHEMAGIGHHVTVAAVAQGGALAVGGGQLCDVVRQLCPDGRFYLRAQGRVGTAALDALYAPLAAVVDGGHAGHTEQQGVGQGQVGGIGQLRGDAGDVVVVQKTQQMLASPFDPMKVDYVTGADLFVKKDILEKYGAFDPAFFMYNEESEMQFRWHKYDVNQYLIDGPQIVHLEGVSMNKVRESISKEMIHAKSRILYYRLTLNKLNYFIYRLFLLLIRTPHIVIERGSVRDKIRYFLILSH